MLPFEAEHGLISISEICTEPNLRLTRIALIAERRSAKLVTKLNKNAAALQKKMHTFMMQKQTPKLVFYVDEGAISARKIDALLEE